MHFGHSNTGQAYSMNGQDYRDRHVFVRLYVQYVRPHLEFSVPAWSPWQKADKECLEKVQKGQ
jgi:hypothetical protein